MPEVPGASEHSVNNVKLSFMRIYLFKYASAVLKQLGQFFETEVPGDPLKAEFLIPTFIGELLDEKKMTVKVLRTNDTWYGMTYKEDVEAVKESFKGMIEDGVYEKDLFGDL